MIRQELVQLTLVLEGQQYYVHLHISNHMTPDSISLHVFSTGQGAPRAFEGIRKIRIDTDIDTLVDSLLAHYHKLDPNKELRIQRIPENQKP